MKEYLVTMLNRFNCELDNQVVKASNEEEAIEKMITNENLIVYSGDRFEAIEYWD